MRCIGFSTGALAYGNFEEGLRLLQQTKATAVELSALRQNELAPLVNALSGLDLHQFQHVSLHVPSSIEPGFEGTLLTTLRALPKDWLLVTHPNVITMWNDWTSLGNRVCIENMDKRKPIARTAKELREIFSRLPDATFCLDLGHAHQIDPTMGEAVLLMEELGERLEQLHVSQVNSESKHDPLSRESEAAFSVVARLIDARVPVILESRLPEPSPKAIQLEMDAAECILDGAVAMPLAGD